METQEWQGAIEAVVFASGEPISLEKLAQALQLPLDRAELAADEVMLAFNRAHKGLQMVRVNDCYQMCTRPEFETQVRLALELKNNAPLSSAAMETLAIVAYHQPVTKAFLEQVRGVDSSGVLNGLLVKGLVEERGRLELPGRPLLYGTTQNFLRCMGLSSLEELPEIPKGDGDAPDANENEQLKLQTV